MTSARSAASSDPAPAHGTTGRPVPPDAEWLLVDGRGGYACGTASDLPTRRYHGMWIARSEVTSRRCMVVASFDTRVGPVPKLGAEWQFDHLMHAHWRGQPRPSRPEALVSFTRRPLPTHRYETRFGVVERTVALRRQDRAEDAPPALLVRYRNRSSQPLRVALRPLLGWCDADHLPSADESFDATVHSRGASFGLRPDGLLPTLWLTVDGVAGFVSEAMWYRGFHYESDRVRGYDSVGDRWLPGVAEIDIPADDDVVVAFALDEPLATPRPELLRIEAAASRAFERAQAARHPLAERLALGADDFVYRAAGDRVGVLAGFPWFGEWGRDVFLALPGLSLARELPELSRRVMSGCLPFLRDGLLPNIYGHDVATSRYNSCDAALWFALAAARHADAGHDPQWVRDELVPALVGIADSYRRGTGLGLAMTDDGLLAAGSSRLNATWMDAETSAGPVTPREGLPVEIQALWYSLLAFLVEHDPGRDEWAQLRDRCGKSFVARFWLPEERYLADRVHDGEADPTIRPNMLVAAALRRSPLANAQRQAVVKVAKRHLVTPCGLRTLSPEHDDYRGVYGGGLEARDRAYHQGTVWPWPAGFYVEAALTAAAPRSKKRVATDLLGWLEQLLQRELDRAGLDHVSEVFDGDEPHRPGGTFAQAWNTGELLRAHVLCREVIAGEGADAR